MARVSKGKVRWLRQQFGTVPTARERYESNARFARYLMTQNPRLTFDRAMKNIEAHDRKEHFGLIVLYAWEFE